MKQSPPPAPSNETPRAPRNLLRKTLVHATKLFVGQICCRSRVKYFWKKNSGNKQRERSLRRDTKERQLCEREEADNLPGLNLPPCGRFEFSFYWQWVCRNWRRCRLFNVFFRFRLLPACLLCFTQSCDQHLDCSVVV